MAVMLKVLTPDQMSLEPVARRQRIDALDRDRTKVPPEWSLQPSPLESHMIEDNLMILRRGCNLQDRIDALRRLTAPVHKRTVWRWLKRS